jgi:septal ring factor EnvC (AmiA/AmiB activator)
LDDLIPANSQPSFRSPPRILIPKLVQSRDQWKAKANQRNRDLKKAQVRNRDLEGSRARWRARALEAEQQLLTLQQQLRQVQSALEQSHSELMQLQEQGEKTTGSLGG